MWNLSSLDIQLLPPSLPDNEHKWCDWTAEQTAQSVTSVGSEQPGLETWARTCGCMGDGGPDRKVTLTVALPEKNWYHMHTVISGEQTIPAEEPLAEGSLCAPTRYMDSVIKSKSTNRRQWELQSKVLTAGSLGKKNTIRSGEKNQWLLCIL